MASSVTVDTNDIDGSGADTGACVSLMVEDLDGLFVNYETFGFDVKAVGVSSGIGLDGNTPLVPATNYVVGGTGYDGTTDQYVDGHDEFYLAKAVPTVTLADKESPATIYGDQTASGNQELFAFEVAVDGTGTVGITDLDFTINTSGLCAVVGGTLNLYELGDTGNLIATGVTSGNAEDFEFADFGAEGGLLISTDKPRANNLYGTNKFPHNKIIIIIKIFFFISHPLI